MYYAIPFLLMVISVNCQNTETGKCSDLVIQRLCIDQEVCDECLQAHTCCNWCYDESYQGRQCNILENLSACSKKKLEVNMENKVEIPEDKNKAFTDGSAKEVIQLKPQFLNVYLAKDTPQNFTFTYKPAKNYPLDLYYLGDMSATMWAHLKIFKTIGADLPNNLTQLTKNYKLAFGSFLDKVGMPFYLTAPDNFDNPCFTFSEEGCETGYLFKHKLSFTGNIDQFIEMVVSSKTTANLDDLDGALDAILQILVCEQKIGWSKDSRKIILLPTDSLLHSAGDGLLVGAVLKPNGTCLLDDEGNHISPLTYDFPSVGQIHTFLKEKKVSHSMVLEYNSS
ncbi:integrin beta-nu [Anoplophora glabripennis]|uniref:integrin beta-nu n=1 Tax=Anoplophora glabripennis TaxID=217634 RepID=UPI000874DBF4|nr:integrin beta-nu [Anoplophora glabripennis]